MLQRTFITKDVINFLANKPNYGSKHIRGTQSAISLLSAL